MVDRVVVTRDAPTVDPNHDAAMAAKADAGTGVEAPAPAQPSDRPEWLPGKFKTPEELARAYSELESKLGGAKSTEQPASPPAPTIDANAADPSAALAERGINFDELVTEYSTANGLSDATYEKLAKAGIPKSVVDNYVEGQRAKGELIQATVFAEVGGADGFAEMVAWARANMTPAEIQAYNDTINSGDVEKTKLAVRGVFTKFQSARPAEPSLLNGNPAAASGDVFESWHQVTEAMRNPLYSKDPAYRAKVEAKISRSRLG